MTIKSLVKCDVSKDRSRKPKNAKHRRRESSSGFQESRERSTTPRGQPGRWPLGAGSEQQEGCILHCDCARMLMPRGSLSPRDAMQASEKVFSAMRRCVRESDERAIPTVRRHNLAAANTAGEGDLNGHVLEMPI